MLGEEELKHVGLLPPNLCRFGVMLRTRVKFWRVCWCCSVILTSCSPESTSRRRISMRPSRRSVYKSPIRQVTRPRWEFTHLVKVFFCTASRSSAVGTTVEAHVYNNSGFTTLRQIHTHTFVKNTFFPQQKHCQCFCEIRVKVYH